MKRPGIILHFLMPGRTVLSHAPPFFRKNGLLYPAHAFYIRTFASTPLENVILLSFQDALHESGVQTEDLSYGHGRHSGLSERHYCRPAH